MAAPRKTARPVVANAGIEKAYRRALDRLIREMSDSARYWLEAAYRANPPRLEQVEEKAAALAQDALPSELLAERMRELSQRWIKRFDEMAEKIAKRFATSVQRYSDDSFRQALKDAGWTVQFKTTPVLRDVLNASIKENVALIRSIPQQYFLEVEGIVFRGFSAGRDLKAISDDLKKRYGVTSRRAALIARDQSNKATAAVVRTRRAELGITQAIWVHSGGGKEPRPSHVKAGRDRLVFDITKGAYLDGEWVLPGEAINCRCSSKSILPF